MTTQLQLFLLMVAGWVNRPQQGVIECLQAHWETLIAADFFTTEVLSWNGLITFYTLFAMDLRSRSVPVCGTTVSPDADGMKQTACQLVDAVDGFTMGKPHPIIDRDTKYGEGFRQILESASVKSVPEGC